MINPSPYPINKLVLSHSARSVFRSCARKLEFRQFYGERAKREDAGEEDTYSADCGKALHSGFNRWLVTQDEVETYKAFLFNFPYSQEFLKPYYAKRSFEACVATLETLIHAPLLKGYEIAKIKLPTGEVKDCVEVPFAIEITSTPFPLPVWFVGFIDCILYDAMRDRYIVVDLKTTRQWFEDIYARFEYDEQCVPYGIILEHALGRPIEELEIAYLSVFIDLKEPKLQLIEVKKSETSVQDWHFGLCDDISRIARYYNAQKFPRTTDGRVCVSWNKKCFWYDECYMRDPETLVRAIGGEPRATLFSNGEEPWITATLGFVEG